MVEEWRDLEKDLLLQYPPLAVHDSDKWDEVTQFIAQAKKGWPHAIRRAIAAEARVAELEAEKASKLGQLIEAVGEWQSKWAAEHEQLLQKIQQLEADAEHYRKRISQLLQERSWEKWGKSLKLRYELEKELGTEDIEEAIEEVRRLKRLAEQKAANKR